MEQGNTQNTGQKQRQNPDPRQLQYVTFQRSLYATVRGLKWAFLNTVGSDRPVH